MIAENGCRGCGNPLPIGALDGLCPVCLPAQGLGGDGSASGVTGPFMSATTRPGLLDTLARTTGGLPRVLLRDSEIGDGSRPVGPAGFPRDARARRPLGRLQLLGEIARGGMGAVLKGRDPDLGRDLAVKVLLESHRDKPELIRRFVEEAQIGGQLQHPGIVPIYELGTLRRPPAVFRHEAGQGPHAGEPARRAVGPGTRPAPLPLDLRVGLPDDGLRPRPRRDPSRLEAVEHHGRLVRRGAGDGLGPGQGLAPGRRGRRRLGRQDAGPRDTVIATARSGSDADSDLSQAGSVMGTPSYMAPEQARGEVDQLDERCDVFALGSILCELLTGEPAFTGRSSGEIQRKAARGELTEAIDRLDASGADAELIALAKDCLAPERDDRPRHAGEVAARINAYQTGVQERLRQAEIARAEEKARAEEATKRAGSSAIDCG